MKLQMVLVIVGIAAVILAGIAFMVAKFFRKVDQGRALIINRMRGDPIVTFTGGIVYPIVHRAEVMDISVKTIELERRGAEGLICKDNIRADIKVAFFVRVNKTEDDVLKVASAIGCQRASDQQTMEDLFVAKFSEALKTVGKRLDFEQLYTQRDDFKDQIIEVIGRDLNGYSLEDAAIDFLEQTPLSSLDKGNILDAQGIRKITELTAIQNIKTNDLQQKERMELGKQNLEADEAIFRYDEQRAAAEAKKAKEISISQARESNEAERVHAEESKRTALVQQQAEQEVKIGEENKLRAIEVANRARAREVAVEDVRVKKAADIEEIGRERDVELRRIDKEKALEVERKNIADVKSTRIAVEKKVAEEEERIKDLRAHAGAERAGKVIIVTAEAEAQQSLVKTIKAAEAQEEVARFDAKKLLTLAEADLEIADKHARAKMRLAEGVQAEEAATGLAKVRVQEAQAVAIEKQGRAEAMVEETKGLAAVKVRKAQAEVMHAEAEAQAKLIADKKIAEAKGDEEKGLALARVQEAEALAIEKRGIAEALAIEKRMQAEAKGLAEKANAMKALDGEGREHEEFRIRLEAEKAIQMEKINAQVQVAQAQAKVLAQAFEEAKINIVGGDGEFFQNFIKAISLGQSTDAFMEHSQVAQKVLGGYTDGSRSLPDDLKGILGGLSPDKMRDLTLTAVLAQMARGADSTTAGKLADLADRARELGIDRLS